MAVIIFFYNLSAYFQDISNFIYKRKANRTQNEKNVVNSEVSSRYFFFYPNVRYEYKELEEGSNSLPELLSTTTYAKP